MNSTSPNALRVAWCDHKAATYATKHWHYTKTLPTPPLLKMGVWEHGKFIGAVIFSRGATGNLGTPYGLKTSEVCELTRVALGPHKTTVSRILRVCFIMLKKQCPGLRLIVSFADANQGHHGGIYQAGNWLFAGDTAPGVEYYDSSGRKWHSRQVSVTGMSVQYGAPRAVPKTSDCRKVKLAGKHRYLLPLDAEMAKKIAPLKQPYPKRKSVAEGA